MKRLVAAALAACGGSAATPDAPIADAPPVDAFATVTGRIRVQDLRNGTDHLPLVDDRAFTTLAMRVRGDDGTWTDVAPGTDDSFSFALPESRGYGLELAPDGARSYELQVGLAHLDLAHAYGTRYERTPVPAGTTLAISLTGAPGTGNAIIYSTGVWAALGRANGTNASFSLDWTPALGLLDASANDRAYAAVMDNVGTPVYQTLTYACSADVTMTGGTATPLACALSPLPLERCLHLRAHFPEESTRLAAALPAGIAYTKTYSWNIFGAPSTSLGATAVLPVSGAGYTNFPPTLLDRDQTTYSVPFAGHTPVVAMTMQAYRSLVLAGTTSGPQISVLTQHFALAAADCSTPTEMIGTVALAGVPVLAGNTLDHDGVSFMVDRTRDLDLTWPIAASGRADFWQATLFTLTPQAGATKLGVQRSWIVLTPHVAINPAELAPGTSYIVQLVAYQGYPDAPGGDLRTQTFPWATGQQWSGIFTVQN
jgi:hypothetical protein